MSWFRRLSLLVAVAVVVYVLRAYLAGRNQDATTTAGTEAA
jgi:hypothetical protein